MNTEPQSWESFDRYQPLPGFSQAWRVRLRELGAALLATPGGELRPKGRPPHRLRYTRCRSQWPQGLPTRIDGPVGPLVLAGATAEPYEAMFRRSTNRAALVTARSPLPRELLRVPPGAVLYVEAVDRDSEDSFGLLAFAPAGLLGLLRKGVVTDWRMFEEGPEALDALVAMYAVTGDAPAVAEALLALRR